MLGDFIGVYRTPNNQVLGSKYSNMYGIWAQEPSYLGPWTLRVKASTIDNGLINTHAARQLDRDRQRSRGCSHAPVFVGSVFLR